MRLRDIQESFGQLDEVAMNPTALRKLASTINATAGMEFELIVPDASNVGDGESDRDMSQDRTMTSFDDVMDFFNDGDWNSRSSVEDVIGEMQNEYYDWAYEKGEEEFTQGDNESDAAWYYIKYNMSADDIAKNFPDKTDLDRAEDPFRRFDSDAEFERKVLDQATEALMNAVEEGDEDFYDIWNEVKDEWIREWMDSGDAMATWFEENYESASDVFAAWSIQLEWPYWDEGGDSEEFLSDLAEEFSEVTGKQVNYSTSYHGAERLDDGYSIEPDSSLEGDDGDGGLEFISPPMSVGEMLDDIDKIVDWARKKGIYTNQSTGLHMNIGLDNYSLDRLDFVKLALLMGDEYVLKQFGRLNNSYARSAMKNIQDAIKYKPDAVAEIFAKFKGGLSEFSTKAIHSGETTKFTSINTKQGYVEFRSPGGNWLDGDIDKVKNTLLRFVVALDAAVDPQKYYKEYMKKLYTLLTGTGADQQTIAMFVKYATGLINREELKIMVKRVQTDRAELRQPKTKNTPTNIWTATNDDGEEFVFSMPTNGSTPKDYEAARDRAIELAIQSGMKVTRLRQEFK